MRNSNNQLYLRVKQIKAEMIQGLYHRNDNLLCIQVTKFRLNFIPNQKASELLHLIS